MPIVSKTNSIPDSVLAGLADRDVSLWVRGIGEGTAGAEALATLIRLPWKQVFVEETDPRLILALDAPDTNSKLIRRRGFLHRVDTDPSRLDLPARALPIFLLAGRDGQGSPFERQLRQMTMLEELRRSGVRQLVVLSNSVNGLPVGIRDIWATGFRTRLILVDEHADSAQRLDDWLDANGHAPTPSVVSLSTIEFAAQVTASFASAYEEERLLVRQRSETGTIRYLDLTDVDDPERPLLDRYDLILERDLAPVGTDELPEDSFNAFFRGESNGWRAFAAGLPWIRNGDAWLRLQAQLGRLDSGGSSENRVVYIMSEPGAGGTTLARYLAFTAARAGYPTLVAKTLPFTPDELPLTNYLIRANQRSEDTKQSKSDGTEPDQRLYETPWLLVFDRVHWDARDAELRRLLLQFERAGRPTCILVVTGPVKEPSYYDESRFKLLTTLNHMLDQAETLELGRHLNRFLRVYGKERPDWQWNNFQELHSVRYLEGIAAFWITLSFWLQTQYDLSDSIQEWVYRGFKKSADTPEIRKAVLEIAALSSERLPMPEALIEQGASPWPVPLLLDDRRGDFSSLGLVRLSVGGRKYWALAHDILGRLLINAVFYDHSARTSLGFADAKDAQHLRFLLLREVSQKPALGEAIERDYGEEFATTIFKIDPDRGRGSWAHIWPEVLAALDGMAATLRNDSRVFRHHTAISRRRIAWLDEVAYGVSDADRVELLQRGIDDINYALRFIDGKRSDEPDVNLYNSLANAYFDLARVRASQNAPAEELTQLRGLASSATRHAYELSPSNPYVIETHVKSLIASAEEERHGAAEHCIEALEIVYSAIRQDDNELRRYALSRLADRAFAVLMTADVKSRRRDEPDSPTDVLVGAWITLATAFDGCAPGSLEEVDPDLLQQVLRELDHSAGTGNAQVARLRYQVLVTAAPLNFVRQLEALEELFATDSRMSPQLRLEYALLMFQQMRTEEANAQFKLLRRLWRENEIFVHVPDQLRWLLESGSDRRRVVTAVSAYDHGHRAMAHVREFARFDVPYRPQEFDVRSHRPGTVFSAHVSFGHNGPFLRPVTAPRR